MTLCPSLYPFEYGLGENISYFEEDTNKPSARTGNAKSDNINNFKKEYML